MDESFADALAESQAFIRSVLRRHCPHPSLLDDLVQEALLRAWECRASFRAGSEIKAWLFVVAKHAAIDYSRRKRGKRRPYQPLEVVTAPAPDHHQEVTAERLASMVEAGDVLSDRQRRWFLGLPAAVRRMILTAAAEPITDNEMAQRMGIPPGTVKSQIYRACREAPRT